MITARLELERAGTFLRQSTWLMLATVCSGVFMVATQIVAIRWMEPAEYGVWFALLRIYLLMSIPAMGLQIVFARQSAAAVTEARRGELAHALRAVVIAAFLIWLALAGVALFGSRHWMEVFKITHPAALWMTVLIGLCSLWMPMVKGVLQGRQEFGRLGWVLALDGVGRFVVVSVILMLGGQAAGGMTGALIGQGIALLAGGWWCRHQLFAPGDGIEWRPWVRRVIPLTLGFGAIQLMGNADVVYVQGVFAADQSPLYMPAAMIGLTMVAVTLPLVSVMFPKVVRSVALDQDTRALRHALGATAALGGGIALVCTLTPELPLRILFFSKPGYWVAAPLVPWYAWSLLPLILAHVFIANLLARERFAIVPWAVVIALGYVLTLAGLKSWLLTLDPVSAFRTVIQTLGIFGLLLLATSGWFLWREKRKNQMRAT